MKIPQIKGILQELNISPNKFIIGKEIYSIILKTGECISSNFYNLRISFGKKYLYLKYGMSEGFGSIIINPTFSYGGKTVFLTKIKKPISFEKLNFPKPGDMFRVSYQGKILFETLITSSTVGSNGTSITLAKPFSLLTEYQNYIFSYYSAIPENELNIKGEIDGLYLKFNPLNKKEYQRKIKYSNILKIISSEGKAYE